jgi:hypothetical protein
MCHETGQALIPFLPKEESAIKRMKSCEPEGGSIPNIMHPGCCKKQSSFLCRKELGNEGSTEGHSLNMIPALPQPREVTFRLLSSPFYNVSLQRHDHHSRKKG